MKKLTAFWFACLFTFAFCLASYAGQWTAHGYFYKPSLGASGQTEYNLFNQGLDQADAELFALDPPPGLVATPPLTYNAANGVIALPQASATVSGYLASGDWSAFNAKQPAISPGATSQYWRGDKTWQTLNPAAVGAAPATAGTSILKGNGSGGTTAAVSNTDYAAVRDNGDPTYLWNGNKLLSRISDIWASITGGNLIVWGSNIYGTNLATVISTIGSSTPANLIVPPGTFTISANVATTPNIRLLPQNGANISIPTGVTLTINGPFEAGPYQMFSYTGTGQGPQANNTGVWPLIFSRTSVEKLYPQWWGAKGTDSSADFTALQQMVDCSIASGGLPMFCPAGVYKLTDTLKLGYGAPGFVYGALFEGAGANLSGTNGMSAGNNGNQMTAFDATGFGDRPAINIQASRQVQLKGFRVFGRNVAPQTAAFETTGPDPNKANWITSGCVDSQYAPYCGISIDAYAGTAPTGGYSNDTYGRGTSSGTFMEDVMVQYFVVGLMLTPSSNNAADDFFSGKDCDLMYNTYGYSSGANQSDSINFYNCWIERNWCSIITNAHGALQGHWPNIFGGGMQDAWKLFEGSSQGTATIEGIWCEAFTWLGNFGVQVAGQAFSLINFVGDHFSWGVNAGNPIYEPYFFTANNPIKFDTCDFNAENRLNVWNFFNGNNTTFINCSYWNFAAGPNFIGINDYAGGLAMLGYQYINCNVYVGSGTASTCPNNQYLGMAGFARQLIAPWTSDVKLWGNNGFSSCHVNLMPYGYEVPSNDFSGSLSITGTNHSAVLSFTANNSAEWLTGDIILWQVYDRTATIAPNVPAFKVTNVNSGTGVVTAQSLLDNINVAYAPNHLYKALPLFINGAVATGNTHNNTTVDNVTNISNFAVGDYIQGAGITWARIVNISGTTITLSRNASATANGVSIYNCGLTAY
jgi:hypothetical protein